MFLLARVKTYPRILRPRAIAPRKVQKKAIAGSQMTASRDDTVEECRAYILSYTNVHYRKANCHDC